MCFNCCNCVAESYDLFMYVFWIKCMWVVFYVVVSDHRNVVYNVCCFVFVFMFGVLIRNEQIHPIVCVCKIVFYFICSCNEDRLTLSKACIPMCGM